MSSVPSTGRQRIVVAMSGGVDSSVAAALLHQQGYEVIGITMTLSPSESQAAPAGRGCCSVWDVNDAEKVAWKLGIPHYAFNLRDEFQKHVIDDFVSEYAKGRTPNPCRRCNQHIKFDHLLRRAEELGCDQVVTGHYAQIRRDESGVPHLYKGKDAHKDQSYVLAGLTMEQLRRVQFPIGEYTKAEVREMAIALELHAVANKPESQDLCFIPDGNTAGFLEKHLPAREPGAIVDSGGKTIGKHNGLGYYTIGQRRGLGIAEPKPKYVLELNVANNQLIVGDDNELDKIAMEVEELNWIQPQSTLNLRAGVKYRSTTPEAPATLEPIGPDLLSIRFDEVQRALAPGQAAVFYQGDEVIGGGTILKITG
jgi:tRNA-uridine 2-sulfurtransferase